jgi:MtfA peptidase
MPNDDYAYENANFDKLPATDNNAPCSQANCIFPYFCSMFLLYILFFAVIALLIIMPFLSLLEIFGAIAKHLGIKDWYNRKLFFQSTDPIIDRYLAENFRFYQSLSNADKVTFERRVQKFIDMKTFESREDLYITLEMEALVAASAIQVTFGYPSVYLSHFDRIILYPDAYYSPAADNYHKGEVHSGGVIVLSWKNLSEGYGLGNDGRNLALHEMAHALRVADFIVNKEQNFLDRSALLDFHRHARIEMEKIEYGEESFFRKYAATNDHEFFAIAVENFFERPDEFLKEHPELLRVMERLLNQPRPIRVTGH